MIINPKIDDFPFSKAGRWADKSEFFLLNVLRDFVWTLRLFSPASWIGPFFAYRHGGKVYSHPNTAEFYTVLAFLPTIIILLDVYVRGDHLVGAGIWAVIVIVENIQYQLQTVFLRPVFQRNYRPYSPERTLIIFVLQYAHTTLAYSIVYWVFFSTDFIVAGNAMFSLGASVEFSAITISTVGYGSIFAQPGTAAAIVAASEAVLGVFFLGLAISVGVSRTTQSKPIKLSSTSTIQSRCSAALDKAGYRNTLLSLTKTLNDDLWIAGGWIRSSALNVEYNGDIDCLTTTAPELIPALLLKSDLHWQAGRLGGYRATLSDGNHIDVSSTFSHCGRADLRHALRRFNYSVNAAAVNLSTNRYISTSDFESDSKQWSFNFQDHVRFENKPDDLALFKDFEILALYYGLRPLERTHWISEKLKSLKTESVARDPRQLLRVASAEIGPLIPHNAPAWIVRGYVRCAILGDLQYWDDLDVVVACCRSVLLRHLQDSQVSFVLNFFGNPKVLLPTGRSVDIWALPADVKIDDYVLTFAQTADMLYWSVQEQCIGSPNEEVRMLIDCRRVSVNLDTIESSDEKTTAYVIAKTYYLLLRHQLAPEPSVIELLSREFGVDSHLERSVVRLVQELHLSGVCDFDSNTSSISDTKYPSHVEELFSRLWTPRKL